mgnify:CR=1 FL=1
MVGGREEGRRWLTDGGGGVGVGLGTDWTAGPVSRYSARLRRREGLAGARQGSKESQISEPRRLEAPTCRRDIGRDSLS